MILLIIFLFLRKYINTIHYQQGADTRGNIVLQGTQLRPEIVVRSFNGPSHSNLNVLVKYAITKYVVYILFVVEEKIKINFKT